MHDTYQNSTDGLTARRTSILVYLMVAVAFLVVIRPSIHGNDGVQNYAYLRSLLFDGDLDFSNEYEHFFSHQSDWFDNKQIPRDPVTDLPINLYGVGNSIMWAPWVVTAHGIGKMAKWAGADITLNGYSYPYVLAVGYGSCFYASLALVLLYRKLRAMTSAMSASWSLLLIWLASPLFFYMYLHPSMSHANSFFLATVMLLQYLSSRDSLLRWLGLGLTCGLMTITRFQDGILMLAMLVGELWLWRESSSGFFRWLSGRWRFYAVWMAGFGVALIPQILAWHVLQGSWFSGPRAYVQQGEFSFLAPAYTPHALFSDRHGLFYWHPGLILGLAGLFAGGSYLRLKLMSLSAFTGQAWIIGSWSIWWAGASFGHRMFISALPFIAIGALFTVGRKSRMGVALRVLVLFLIAWNFGLVVQYGLGWISRQESVPISEMSYNNFVRIPRVLLGLEALGEE